MQGHFKIVKETDLFVDRVSIAKDEVSSNQASDEGIYISLLAPVEIFLHQEDSLVQRDKFGKVEGMLFRGTVN